MLFRSTALYIQLIDFLAIKRRPEREKYLQRFLQIQDSHRQALEEIGETVGDASEDRKSVV